MMTARYQQHSRITTTAVIVLLGVAVIGVWALSRALGRASESESSEGTKTESTTTNTNSTTMASVSQTQIPISSAHYAIIKTSLGDITMQLFPEDAPKTVQNFVTLAKRGYYDGLIFHRIVKDFVAQGGDPKGDGSGGESIYGETFADEINSHKNVVGAVAMANRGANTNGSQFFIVTTQAQPYLDGSYTVFGQVIGDLSILQKLNAVETKNDRPVTPVTMMKVLTGDDLTALQATP